MIDTRSINESAVKLRYESEGCRVMFPDDVSAMGTHELIAVAEGVVRVLDNVYDRDRRRSARRIEETIRDVGDGTVHLFAILRKGQVVATTRLTKSKPLYALNTNIVSYEGGGTAKDLTAAPPVRAGQLLAAQYAWARTHLAAEAHYLYSNTRVAEAAPGRPFNGNILAQTLTYEAFIPAYAGYFNTVGTTTVEPFVHLEAPLDLRSWSDQVHEQTIFAPDAPGADILRKILTEGTGGMLEPQISTCSTFGTGALAKMYEIEAPSSMGESIHVMTDDSVMPHLRVVREIPSSNNGGSAGISDRVIVEQDVIGDRESAHQAYQFLVTQGFYLSGWVCSSYVQGRIALIFGRAGGPARGGRVAGAYLHPQLKANSPTAYDFFDRILKNYSN